MRSFRYHVSQYIVVLGFAATMGETTVPALAEPQLEERLAFFRTMIPTNAKATAFTKSDWLAASLTSRGAAEVRYLNVSVNGVWVIRNIPVLSVAGQGTPQTNWYAFGGAGLAEAATPISYGFSLLSNPSEIAPISSQKAAMGNRPNIVCFFGGPGGGLGKPGKAGPLEGGALASGEKAHVHAGFPNQEAKFQGCGPAAFSNSLQWLNKTQNLGLKDDDISIEKMEKVLGWKPGQGNPDQGIKSKAKAFKDTIDTSVDVPVNEIGKLMDKGCDVEIAVEGHIGAVVGIAKLENGKYSIDVAHDTLQERDKKSGKIGGGPKTETVTYSPGDQTIRGGGAFLNEKKLKGFIVECKKGK